MSNGLLPLTQPGAVFAVLFLLVLVGPLAAARARLPAIIGLIVAGMMVGPNVTGILGRDTFIETLGYVGLLYLLFQAGLDLDLTGFARRRRESIVFGVITSVIPMVMATYVGLWLGIDLLPAIIIASALTSHTLLSYPTIARFDLTKNPAVTATLGATLLCTVVALLILAVAAAAGGGNSSALYWIGFSMGMAGYLVLVLIGVPRFTRWFFTGLGQDRQVRLTYLLSGMGLAAIVADMVGIEPIVGAFLIGLAFNRFVPDGTIIAERVQVLGQALFIPAFLISTGMMLDPVAIITDTSTLLFGLAFAAVAVAAKWISAELAGLLMGASRAERGVMFSLSVGQAAGALAAVIVAEDLGLIGQSEVNAIVLVILVTALVAGLTADRYAPSVEALPTLDLPLGTRVVVPVANPASIDALVRIAARIAAADGGAVVAVNVLPYDADQTQVRAHRKLGSRAEEVALAAGAEVSTSVRIDSSTTNGVTHTVAEHGGTSLVMGWKGYANAREGLFGSTIDQIVTMCRVPVLVCRPGNSAAIRRAVVVVESSALVGAGARGVELALGIADRLTVGDDDAAIVVVTDASQRTILETLVRYDIDPERAQVVRAASAAAQLPEVLEVGDVVVAGAPPTTERLGRGAQRLARLADGHTVIVAIPH